MKKTKTLFEQLKDRANQLSAGEAIIVLDEINKKEGFENAVIFLNSRMKHIRQFLKTRSHYKAVGTSILSWQTSLSL
jgi:predicted AAA+ superfamily ATPase